MTNSTSRRGVVRAVVGFTGKMLLLARPKRNVSERKRKALLIGIHYGLQLRFPHRDMRKMHTLLKDNFQFRDEDIITLTDELTEVEAGTSLAPTRENIMQAVSEFIIRGQDNTDYVLFYSGHADQHDEPDKSVEEDGKKEFIMPVDTERDTTGEYTPNSVIYDTYLHEQIIEPLDETRGCHLFAVFDCCHSATLLNLKHERCNRIGKPTSLARRVVRRYIVEDTFIPLYRMVFRKTTRFRKCNGFCPRVPNRSRKSTVVCISACKDRETAFEHETSDTAASAIVNLLQAKPKSTIKDVMYAIRYAVDQVHQAAKDECGGWKNVPIINLFIPPAAPSSSEAELALAGWDPQLSSNDPLDTNTTLMYSDIRTQKLDRHGRIRRSPLESVQRRIFARAGTPNPSLPTGTSSRRASQL